jgi:hypothetical protein
MTRKARSAGGDGSARQHLYACLGHVHHRFGQPCTHPYDSGIYCPGAKHIARAPAWLGHLNTAELALWEAFAHGETVDLRSGDPAVEAATTAPDWPDNRRIRAK